MHLILRDESRVGWSGKAAFRLNFVGTKNQSSVGSIWWTASKLSCRTRRPPSSMTLANKAAHGSCNSSRLSSAAACNRGITADGLGTLGRSLLTLSRTRAVLYRVRAGFLLGTSWSQSPPSRTLPRTASPRPAYPRRASSTAIHMWLPAREDHTPGSSSANFVW